MLSRCLSKRRFLILLIFLLSFLSIIYFYVNILQENYGTSPSGDHCVSELTSTRYQLNVVTEYKNRIDALLTETQKAHESDKERFKDIMESCIAMKQQTAICQSQFEDLQSECKKVREDYDKLRKGADGSRNAR